MGRRQATNDSVFHARFCNMDVYGWGDRAALLYLQDRGFKLTEKLGWRKPRANYLLSEFEATAIQYLKDQWKFKGLEDG